MDSADDGRGVARQHGDAGMCRGGVARAEGHVAASWRTASGQQTSTRARLVLKLSIVIVRCCNVDNMLLSGP